MNCIKSAVVGVQTKDEVLFNNAKGTKGT